MKIKLFKQAKNLGFTMIELLIVISILGILAVAVLSAINPVEQINRGRDTGMRSDAEQLLGAVDRYDAFQGFKPWVRTAATVAADAALGFTEVEDTTWVDDGTNGDCEVLAKLGEGDDTATDECVGSQELKSSYLDRVSDGDYRGLYIYQGAANGNSTYVCFRPQSSAFQVEATGRCTTGLPDDIDAAIADGLCGDETLQDKLGADIDTAMICLP